MQRRVHLQTLLAAILAAIFISGCEEQAEPQTNAPQVLAFTATWCEPCKAAKPHLQSIKAAGIAVTEYDIDERPDLAQSYNIRSVPTYIVYDANGRQVERTSDIRSVLKLLRILNYLR